MCVYVYMSSQPPPKPDRVDSTLEQDEHMTVGICYDNGLRDRMAVACLSSHCTYEHGASEGMTLVYWQPITGSLGRRLIRQWA
jgi:hypothetical protein